MKWTPELIYSRNGTTSSNSRKELVRTSQCNKPNISRRSKPILNSSFVILPTLDLTIRKTDPWLKVYPPSKPSKDSSDSINNIKSENNNIKSTKKVNNFSGSNARLIQLYKKPNSNWPILKNYIICIPKSSNKSTPSKKCSGLRLVMRRSQPWNKARKSTANNVSSYPKILNSGKPINSLKPVFRTSNFYYPSSPSLKKIPSRIDIGKRSMPRPTTGFLMISLSCL